MVPKLNAAGTAYVAQSWFTREQALPYEQRFSSGDVANAVATATMPAVAGMTAYITGFEIYADNATAAVETDLTIAGLLGGSQLFPVIRAAGSSSVSPPDIHTFDKPLAANAANQAVTASLPALGTGSAKVQVVLKGFYA